MINNDNNGRFCLVYNGTVVFVNVSIVLNIEICLKMTKGSSIDTSKV